MNNRKRTEEPTVVCPVCDGDGEFLTEDDVYTCPICDGLGCVTKGKYKEWSEWCKEMSE